MIFKKNNLVKTGAEGFFGRFEEQSHAESCYFQLLSAIITYFCLILTFSIGIVLFTTCSNVSTRESIKTGQNNYVFGRIGARVMIMECAERGKSKKYAEANDKKFSRMMFEAIGDEAKSDPDLAAAILERTGQKSGKHSDIASKLAGDTVVHNRTYFTLLQKVTAYDSFVVCIL